MVDDTMEISSDHGHNNEQGDIDLDIDLTEEPVDEDFVLEDVISNVDDIGNELHPQSSMTVKDDIMLDDDNGSYQMEDAELLEEETEPIMEQESMSFATDRDAPYYGAIGQVGEQNFADDTHGLGYEAYDETNDESLGFDLQQDPEVVPLEESLQDPDDSDTKSAENVSLPTAGRASQNSSPSRQSLPPTAPTEPRSPPASVLEPVTSPAHSAHDTTDLLPLHDGSSNPVELQPASDATSFQHVVVVYRDIEYALFSASEHDDPDLYFLSDKTIAEKPLSEFFRAIRDVIRNDLTDEDELCLVVDSLGLQAEEVSSFIEDVSLIQVLNLHAKLAENDGVEDSGGCYIALKTRTSFCRRLSTLMAGAAEGKGLSHYGYWDEQSIGLDDSEDQGDENGFESNCDGQQVVEPTENHHEDKPYGTTEINASGQDVEAQPAGEADVQESETTLEWEARGALPEQTSSTLESVVMTPQTTPFQTKNGQKERESDVDEDGDLIDYSDDEAPKVVKEREAAAYKSDTDETATAENLEHKDEFQRRRSLDQRQSSVVATPEEGEGDFEGSAIGYLSEERKDEVDETAPENQKSNDESETLLPTEDNSIENDGSYYHAEKEEDIDLNENGDLQYGVQEGENFDVANSDFTGYSLDYGHERKDPEEPAMHDVAKFGTENDQITASLEQSGEHQRVAQLIDNYAAVQYADSGNATTNHGNNDLEIEIGELPIEDESQLGNEHPGPSETNGHISTQDVSKASSLDVVETAESSVTIGADEIQFEDNMFGEAVVAEAKKSASRSSSEAAEIVEQKDEIDYEDDDEEAELSLPSPTAKVEGQGYQNVNGKRSIADVESNDSQILQPNDAKRSRS